MPPDRLNRRRYDFYAPFYDGMAVILRPARRAALDRLALQPGERVLIVGCGTGLDFDHLPSGVHVTGLDVSPGMLQRARARAARLGLPADLREGDARALPFADAAFDVVILHLILAVAPDPELVARESARVLRRGGRVSVFDKFLPLGQRPSFLRSLLNVAARRLFSDLNRHVEPLLAAAHLTLVSDLPGAFGGRYRHLLARKP